MQVSGRPPSPLARPPVTARELSTGYLSPSRLQRGSGKTFSLYWVRALPHNRSIYHCMAVQLSECVTHKRTTLRVSFSFLPKRGGGGKMVIWGASIICVQSMWQTRGSEDMLPWVILILDILLDAIWWDLDCFRTNIYCVIKTFIIDYV